MLLGPGSGMDEYAGHPLVGTAGVPLVVYPGLKVRFVVLLALTWISSISFGRNSYGRSRNS